MNVKGQGVSFVAIDAHAPELLKGQRGEYRRLVQFLKGIKPPMIMTGDFNLNGYSHVFKWFLEQASLYKSDRFMPSWPGGAGPMGFEIDHILISKDLSFLSMSYAASFFSSDHRGIISEVGLSNKNRGGFKRKDRCDR